MMNYKGYIATIEYDDSMGLLHGQVVNAGAYPIVTFEAVDVEGLKREFRISVEEYLASCVEDGVEPRKPFSGKLTLRLGPELHQHVAVSAIQSGMSINEWIKHVLAENVQGR